MIRTILVTILLASAAVTPGQSAPAHLERSQSSTHEIGRNVTNLSKLSWKFKLEALDDTASAIQFDDRDWTSITVPHTWNRLGAYGTERPADTNRTQGIGWYRLHVLAPVAKVNQRQYLDFGAVSAIADVWVNGAYIGQHKGGFSRFRFDVTESWKPGQDNVIAVRADNSKPSSKSSTADVLPLAGDFFIYGGVYREVSLISTENISFDLLDFGGPGVYARTLSVRPNGAEIEVTTRLANAAPPGAPVLLTISIKDSKGRRVAVKQETLKLATGKTGQSWTLSVANPHLWNGVDAPYLYTVEATLSRAGRVVDHVVQPLGIRTFAFDADKGFTLNGKNLQLHGVSRHQDRAEKGWALSSEDQNDDMALIKEMGANTVRMAHYEHADEWVSAADRQGMITWAEVPFVTAASFDGSEGTSALFDNATQQLRELIHQDYNHPSIVTWSIGNEVDAAGLYLTAGKPVHPLSLLQHLNEVAKAEDPSRATVFADCCEDSPFKMKDQQALAGTADLIGYNRYYGWYYGKMQDLGTELDKLHQKHPNLPMSLSEYGAGGALSQHTDNPLGAAITPTGRVQPEEYESLFHEESWNQLKDRKYLFATWIWNMFDFPSDMRNEGDSVDLNSKGLVAFDHKTRKDAFWFYKANWSAQPVVHITQKTYVDRPYPLISVKAYSNGAHVHLTMDGHEYGETKCPTGVCSWENVKLKPGPNRLVVTADYKGQAVSDQATWNGPAVSSGFKIKTGTLLGRSASGQLFGSDNYFTGGQTFFFGSGAFDPKKGTSLVGGDTPALTDTWREGVAFSYHIPVPTGQYVVKLHTFDPGKGTTDNAIVTVMANGKPVLEPYNVKNDAGGTLKAIIKTFEIAIGDAGLQLDFAGSGGPAVVSAIEVLPK